MSKKPGPSNKRPLIEENEPIERKLFMGMDLDIVTDFSNENEDLSDVVLIVEGKKFYCSKSILARHSQTFKSMFFGDFKERDKKEIELKDVTSFGFQLFLEEIHGALKIMDAILEDLLRVSRMFLAPVALKKCRDFLIHPSKKPLKEKFRLAVEYGFDDVKKPLIKNIFSPSQLNDLMPADLNTFDKPTMTLFLEKSLELHGIVPGKPKRFRLNDDD